MLTAQSNRDFTLARQRAFIEDWLTYLRGRSNALLSFDEVQQNLHLKDSAYKGLQDIEVEKIVGSTGRYRDFTRTFLPKSSQTEDRWRSLHAMSEQMGFPPIEVYKVGEVYFVRDGNHRVSVARTSNVKTIEAYVIEYNSVITVDKEDDMDALLLKIEQVDFFAETQLDKIRPDQNIQFTEVARYQEVKKHIAFHKYLKERECGCEISAADAVASWYDNVYLPLVKVIQEQEILKDFPNRTEADLYGWLVLHRTELEEQADALSHISNERILADFTEKKAGNLFTRLKRFLGQRLQRENLPLEIEQAHFLAETHLEQLRPEQQVVFTELGSYQTVREHIAFHKYLKETEQNRGMTYEEAIMSWYDHVYLPLIQLIRQRDLLIHFPKRTEADLYLWLVAHRAGLESKIAGLGHIPNEVLVEDLKAQATPTILGWLTRFFYQDSLPSQATLLKIEQLDFFRTTELDKLRPEQNISFSELGGYRLIKEQIQFHKFVKETENQREWSYPEAVMSWYDTVYQPLIELMRQYRLQADSPQFTEAELYIWLVVRRASHEQDSSDEALIEQIKAEQGSTFMLMSSSQMLLQSA